MSAFGRRDDAGELRESRESGVEMFEAFVNTPDQFWFTDSCEAWPALKRKAYRLDPSFAT